jgi:hypothetical protein
MTVQPPKITDLLRRGALSLIAAKLGMTRQAVSLALIAGKPGHPAVIEAIKMAKESGSLDAAQAIASLTITTSLAAA